MKRITRYYCPEKRCEIERLTNLLIYRINGSICISIFLLVMIVTYADTCEHVKTSVIDYCEDCICKFYFGKRARIFFERYVTIVL